MSVEHGSFDVIIGMDWLTKYHVVIVCDEKIIRIAFENEILIVRGDGSNNGYGSRLNIISCTKTQKYLLKGCQVFLARVTTKKAEDKSKEKRLEDVPIVRDFPEVFPEDLPVIMEYLVNISKRRTFWSLNEDILKITVLTTNMPYPSRKIRRICACTHQRPQRIHDQYAKRFKTLSLDELRSPDFNLFSDQEYSEEEVAKTMAETMEQYMSKTRADYGSGVARPNIEDNDNFELKGQFLK
ncbi:hypothetical protein Tco_0858651 [Tanacetum coccineum]|uniref:Reverse transcriptase domain-containing protein n=1 Tax=Tanacetum coccineum TaxID=301880 RepID=A0ABQ5BDS1_9ASTR